MSAICGIYAIRNVLNGKMYVGQSVNIRDRWRSHRKQLGRGRRSYLYSAMRKHGLENFEFIVLEQCDPTVLNERELYWMEHYACRTQGYNVIPAGQTGRVMDDRAREAIAATLRGRSRPAEVVEKVRQAMLGKRHTEDTRRLLSEITRGRAVSEETRRKLSAIQIAAHRRKGHTIWVEQ